ncbi:flagellar motor protein MotB [Pelagibacterium luteolum]|uniref:Chemotaxis protein MotB n=1 Tax=Pelagibacterium luteolum TaxID=440168 RepID=A0A1G7S8A8_9HYPH|nr:flagellar motor protein MotB [Pelagibacterium luteolum]SDG19256.1 chemotaxis protein MotB [Pelagibacterium luteolum]
MARGNEAIIIKRVKKSGHAHHGGAWKIAYADFVTAMMAFFLLLWLISMTTPEQKEGLADYFAPPNISQTTSGSGGIMAGTAMDVDGAMTATTDSQRQMTGGLSNDASAQSALEGGDLESVPDSASSEMSAAQAQVFHSAAASIRQAWQELPDIAEIADNLIVQQTEEGLDILLLNQEGRPMFQEGSKYPFEWVRGAVAAVAPVLQRLPNQIRISGHSAAGARFSDPSYGSWELTSDRANVVRGLLGEFGLSDDRIHSVVGRSGSEPYFANNPYLAANERIKITVLNAPPPIPADMSL